MPPFETELRLPRPPGLFRRWLAAHPRLVDGIIVGFYLFGCALMVAFELLTGYAIDNYTGLEPNAVESMQQVAAHFSWPWAVVRCLVVAATAVALAYRRRFPVLGTIFVSLLLFLEQGLLVMPNSVAVVYLLYAAPVFKGARAGWVAFAGALVLNSLLMIFGGSGGTGMIGPGGLIAEGPIDVRDSIMLAVLNGLWLLAVLMIGINLGNRRRYVEALIDRAHQLMREREQRAQLAAVAERSRIAREMHDIVAHSLSVVVTLSEAASVSVDSQPQAAKHAMERAAETGRSALVEMRRLLGVLSEGGGAPADGRDEDHGAAAPRAPQPGAAQLQGLVEGFRQAGLRVPFTEGGVSRGDATQQLAVYRIVQEALTNALRYAGQGAEARVSLEHGLDGTRIEVVDTGRPGGQHSTSGTERPVIPGSGRGLAGAAERARMFGGEFEAGPNGSGWRVAALVPLSTGGTAPHDEDEDDAARRKGSDA